MDGFDLLEDEARKLLKDHGFKKAEVVRIDPDCILFIADGRPLTAWRHEEHRDRLQRNVKVGVVVITHLHIEAGFSAWEGMWIRDAA